MIHVENLNAWLSNKKAKLFSSCGNSGRILGAKLDTLGIPETDTECHLFIEKVTSMLPREEHVDKYTRKWVLPLIEETRKWRKQFKSVAETADYKAHMLLSKPDSLVKDILG